MELMELKEIIIIIITATITWTVSKCLDRFKAFFTHIFARFFPGKNSYRAAIASNLKKAINKINREIFPDLRLNKIKVETADVNNPEIDQIEDKVILRVSTSKNITEIYKKASEVYAKEVLLERTYNYLKKIQGESVVDYCAREICAFIGYAKATETLDDQIILKGNNVHEYSLYIERYNGLRKHRLFFSIFIPEIRRLSKVLSITELNISNSISDSFEKLLNFLSNIAEKKKGENVPLRFKNEILKIAIVLVADDVVWNTYGTNPYKKRVKQLINDGFETIYIIGAGQKIEYVDSVMKDLKKDLSSQSNIIKKEYKISRNTLISIYKINIE